MKIKLADVLSWDKQYDASSKLYDELLSQREEQALRLQKARVLGWARRYGSALKEYQNILDIKYDEKVDLEMKAKKAYWDNRTITAIDNYKELIEKDTENLEAMFDLAQVYA